MTATNNKKDYSFSLFIGSIVLSFMFFIYFMTALTKDTKGKERQKLEIEKLKLEIELHKILLNDSTVLTK